MFAIFSDATWQIFFCLTMSSKQTSGTKTKSAPNSLGATSGEPSKESLFQEVEVRGSLLMAANERKLKTGALTLDYTTTTG